MPRPKKSDPRERAAYARLSDKEWEVFEFLIEDRQRELREANEDPSLELSQGDVIRWLILREANARRPGAASAARTYATPAPTHALRAAEPVEPYGQHQATAPVRERVTELDPEAAAPEPAAAGRRPGRKRT